MSGQFPETPKPPTESRWAARLSELAHAAAHDAPHAPEPHDLKPKPRLWQRLQRGMAVPAAAAAAAFMLTVIVSIAMVWLQPHSVGAVPTPTTKLLPSNTTSTGDDVGSSTLPDQRAHGVSTDKANTAGHSTKLFVHVVGEIASPGVYELDADARVLNAIEAAGGATEQAMLSALNLARPLSDGEQITVPDAEGAAALAAQSIGVGLGVGTTTPGTAGVTAQGGLVNLNTADIVALETLPRVGPALAQRIIDWRESNGGFSSVDQLTSVSGIGQRTYEQLQGLVTL